MVTINCLRSTGTRFAEEPNEFPTNQRMQTSIEFVDNDDLILFRGDNTGIRCNNCCVPSDSSEKGS